MCLSSLLLQLLFAACQVNAGPSKPLPSNVNAYVGAADPAQSAAHFSSIQAAIDAAPDAPLSPWVISLAAGVYTERVNINKPNITLTGAGIKRSKIVYGRYAGQAVPGRSGETWGTFRTATLTVSSQNVRIAHLSIENSFDFPANEKLTKDDPRRVQGEQAVALEIADQADKTLIDTVKILGYQDTLYIQGGRTYLTNSQIYGHVDFIFGNGNAIFSQSDIVSRPRYQAHKITGYITAPSTLLDNEFGFTFINCRLLKEPGVPDNSVSLGRPWHPTSTFGEKRYANPFAVGKTVFINSFMDAHIADSGWSSMGGSTREGGRKQFDPMLEARFAEYQSSGPGAVINPQRPQLNDTQAEQYSIMHQFAGWLPITKG